MTTCAGGGIGRHIGLKTRRFPEGGVRVQVPSRAPDADDGATVAVTNPATAWARSRSTSHARAKGGEVLTGGKRHALGGLFFEPTAIASATADMMVAREEAFAPPRAGLRVRH